MKTALNSFRPKNKDASWDNIFDSLYSNMLGFDPEFENRFMKSLSSSSVPYPPYDTIQDAQNEYRVILATAGFSQDEISIVIEKNQLTVTGEKLKNVSTETEDPAEAETFSEFPKYLHRGIAMRKFSRSFMLGENIKVKSATYENGLLSIYLVREVPEEQKPRKIEILVSEPKQLTSEV
jgi:molecular chaperone IbpA